MGRLWLVGLAALIVLATMASFGQAVGDFGTTGTAVSWTSSTTVGTGWVICQSEGTWAGATAATRQPNTSADNVWILSGCTVTPSGSPRNVNNLTIESGATLSSATTFSTARYIRVYGTTLTVDGTFGTPVGVTDSSLYDGLGVENWNTTGTLTIQGSGTFRPARVRTVALTTATTTTTVFDMDAMIMWDGSTHTGGTGIFPQVTTTPTTNPTFTINAGRTVTFVDKGGIGTSGTSGSPSTPVVGMTLNVNGSMVLLGAAKISFVPGSGATGTFNIGPSGSVTLGGPFYFGDITFTNNGTFTYGASATLNYCGTVAQATGAELPASVPKLTINNATGITLNSSSVVTGTLTLTTGNVTTGSNTLEIGASGTTSRTAGHIVGNLKKNFAASGSITYEVGTANGYSPVTVNATAGTGDVTVKTVQGLHPNVVDNTKTLARYWTVTSNGVTEADLSFTYLPADVNGTEAAYQVGRYDGSGTSWSLLGGVVAANVGSVTGVTAFGDFSLGEPAALPVQLSSFCAVASGFNGTSLTWTTESEVNSGTFTVERRAISGTGTAVEDYVTVGSVLASGTTGSAHEYSFVDKGLAPGRYAYRLKQIDRDGSFMYVGSAEVEVGAAPAQLDLLGNYPNPFNPSTEIRFSVPVDGPATLTVYNVMGQEVATPFSGIARAGHYTAATFDASRFASGIYFARLDFNGQTLLRRMIYLR